MRKIKAHAKKCNRLEMYQNYTGISKVKQRGDAKHDFWSFLHANDL